MHIFLEDWRGGLCVSSPILQNFFCELKSFFLQHKDVGSAFPDVYDSAFVESGWYAWWKEQGYFSPSGASSEKVFSAILPPPNVTGQLHLGHALTATVQDALVRWLVEL